MGNTAKENHRSKKPKAIRRGFVVLAIAILWAAAHEPRDFTPTSVAIWGLGMLTVTLLARAAFALVEPALKVAIAFLLYASQRHAPPAEDEP